MKQSQTALNVIRRISKTLLVIVFLLAITSFSVVRWTEHQFLNTNNWISTVGPLPKDPVVSSAIGLYVTNQLFTSVDVQKKIADSLPPQASFLAAPLSDQLKELVKKVSTKVVSSDAFQTVWITANRKALDSQLQVARGQKKSVLSGKTEKLSVNIEGIRKQIAAKLGASSEALPALDSSNKKPLAFVADLQAAPKTFQRTVKQIDFTNSVLPYLIVSSFLGILALSINRSKTAFRLAAVGLAIYLIKIISLKVTKDQLLGNVSNQAYVPALDIVFDSLTASLLNIIYAMISLFIVIILISFLSGQNKLAVRFRHLTRVDRIKELSIYSSFLSARPFVKRNIWKITIGLGFIALIGLAISAAPTVTLAIKAALAVIALSTALYIYANPKSV